MPLQWGADHYPWFHPRGHAGTSSSASLHVATLNDYFHMKHHTSVALGHFWCLIVTMCTKSITFFISCALPHSSPVCDRTTTFWRWDIFSALNGPTLTLLSAARSSSSVWSKRRPWLETAPPSCTMSMFFLPLCCPLLNGIVIFVTLVLFFVLDLDSEAAKESQDA